MTHRRVTSSTLHSIGYDSVEGVLSARFLCSCAKDGPPNEHCERCGGRGYARGTYTYPSAADRAKGHQVAPEVYAAIRDAKAKGGSTGKTFAELVKKAKISFDFTPHGG